MIGDIYITKWLSPGGRITGDGDFLLCAFEKYFAKIFYDRHVFRKQNQF